MESLASLKRCFGQEQDGDDDFGVAGQGEKMKRFKFASAVRDVMSERLLKEMALRMEPFFRVLVREEVERASRLFLNASPGPSSNQIESSGVRNWQLHFASKLPSKIFTGSRVEAEGSTSVKIVILDARSKDIITSGPLSSVKIEILVLDGDFGTTDDNEDWTESEFNTNIVREREGKRPLVTGELFVTLRCGVGYIDDVSFTDNSSWIRSRKFRLGARAVSGISKEVRIREARSEAFVVKDHRGEQAPPPSLDDKVWRLERIAKDGASHKRLDSHGIHNVKDFLRLYVTDQSSLRKLLGNGISNKIWEIIIEHANTYVGDEELYVYSRAGESLGVVLSSIYKIVGLTFDSHSYQAVDKLTMQEKVHFLAWLLINLCFQNVSSSLSEVLPFDLELINFLFLWQILMEDLKRHAYKNVNDIKPFPTRPFPTIQTETFNDPCLSLHNFPVTHQDQSDSQMGFDQSPSSSYYDWDDNNQEDPSMGVLVGLQAGHRGQLCQMVIWLQTTLSSFKHQLYFLFLPHGGKGIVFSLLQTMKQRLAFFPLTPILASVMSRKGKPRARWCKIRAALKWGISVRRDVAAKRMEKLIFCSTPIWE
ncbi:Calmodulin-binding protein 60 D [Vitis vinifera]|uniref:Calmodulin-binding protein 60 D n=1 Tax=Vitis vinifera TaxID=29760 RepID=A0A438IME7_VITVI|nr:Calmodulin-binding protein 60 D [Vitis vinifera]